MPNGNDKPKSRLGDIPQETYLKSPREIAAERDDSSSLIGGKGSSALGSFVGNVASNLSSAVAAPFKAIDRTLAAVAGVEYREDDASPFTKLGTGIESAVKTIAAPDPERADQFISKLGGGLGSTLGFLLPGALAGKALSGAVGMAGLGAAATGVEQAEDYERARAEAGLPVEKSDQAASFFYGLLPGTLEAVPLARMLGRYDDIVKGGLTAAVKNTGKGTLEEALQEGIQSTASNLIASDLVKYDKDRDMFFDTPEAAAVGGGVGFLLNSVMSAVGLRQRGKYHEEAMKVQQDQNKIASEQEETQSKINPATGEQLDNAEIAKTNKLINRYTRLSETDQVNSQAYDKRIEELKKELKEKYFTKDEEGKFTSSAADRQEAQDVLTRIGVEEVEQIEAAPAPFKGDVGVAEAEPFPDRMGKSYQVSKITNKKSIEKFNKDLARYRPEEITITGVDEALPGTEGISVEEIQPEVEEINLDTAPAPQERTFFEDRPANTAMAEQLQRIVEQRKRRDETDAAFEARKEAEINEAYRQRELQLAEQEPSFETQEEAVQQTTPEPIDTPQTEQTKEEVSSPPQGSVVTKSGQGYKSEAIAKAQMKNKKIDGEVVEYAPDQFAIIPKEAQDALRRQAGFGETLPEQAESTPQDGTPKFLSDREGIPTPNGIEVTPEDAAALDADRGPVVRQATTPEQIIADRRESQVDSDVRAATNTINSLMEDFSQFENNQKDEEFNRLSKEFDQYRQDKNVVGLARVIAGMRRRIAERAEAEADTGIDDVSVTTDDPVKELFISSYESSKPMSGAMHTLRNPEDIDAVLSDGLKSTTNIGNRNSQAVGNGITLEYDPNDLDFNMKGYNPGEATIGQQSNAKPKRVLVDVSDLGLPQGSGGMSEIDRILDEAEATVPAGTNIDEFTADLGALTLVYDRASYTPSERKAEIDAFESKYGKDAADFFKENGEDLARAMDNPDGVEGITEEQYIKSIQDKVGDIPVYTYEVDEDGKPINIKPFSATPVEAPTKPVFAHNNAEGWRRFNWYIKKWEEGGKRGLPQFNILSDYYPFSRGETVPTEPQAYIEAWRTKMVRDFGPEPTATKKIDPETKTPEGVTPGTIGDLWTATHSEHKHRIERVQGDKYYRTIQEMTEEQVAEYRDYDSAGRRNYIERLHKKRLEPLFTKMSKAGVKKIKQFMSAAKIEGRSKATTKGQMLNLILEEMDGKTEALATGYFSTDKATVSKEANNIVDDDAGYESAGKDLSEGTVEQIVNSPVEKPEQIPLDPEVYDEVIRLGNAMKQSRNPERFVDEITEKFDTVLQFTTMYSSIESGMVVRGEENTTDVIATPVGTVETVEEVIENQSEPIPLPEEVVEISLDEIESRLDTLDIEIQDLQEQLEDPYLEREDKSELTREIARKQREIKELEAQQQGVFAEKKKISEEEIQEVKALDKESENPEVYEDEGPSASYTVETLEQEEITIFGTPRVRTKEEDYGHRAISRFRSQMDPTFKDMVEFYVVTREEDIPAKYASIRHDYKENWENSKASGLYYSPGAGRSKHLVILLPRPGMSRSRVEKTLYHETIGHFGMKKVFGAEWNGFLDMLLKNPDLAAKAYSLRGRWPHLKELVDDTSGLSPENVMQFKEKYIHTSSGLTYFTTQFEKTNGPMRRVSKTVMRKLMDEYLAEISGDMSRESYREVTKQDRSLMKRIGTWIRHLLRKAGIQIPITDSEVLSFVGESYERILGGGVAVFQGKIGLDIDQSKKYLKKGIKINTLVDMNSKAAVNRVKAANNDLIKSRMFVINNGGTPSASMVPSDELNEAHAAMDEAIDVNVDLGFTASREEALRTLRSIDAREGRLDNSTHQRRVERVSDWVRRTKLGKVLSSNGHLPFVRVLNSIEAKGKGGIEKGQVFARKFARLTKDLNDIQKKAMYEYFKTRDADVSNLPVDDEVKRVLSKAKDYIERYGESLVIQGKLRRETWEASKGSYLPIRYWRYMEGYYASGGKRMSLQNYLKQQKGLSAEEKAALGEVKDVSFLVPETIATISRDVALNGMFKNIITFDEVGKLGWTLGERQYTEVNGKKMKLSDIEKKIESLEFLRDVDQDVAPTFKNQADHEEILRQLEQYYEGRDNAKAALREEIHEVLTERGITDITEDMINQVRDREFIQVNDKRYGALHKKFIRKELYDEIIESGQMLDKEHADFFGKAFGAGGYADRANQRWKSLKVTLNPPSWFRNGLGNLFLMDIGTNTSMNKLVGILVSEANEWRKGRPSKYFDIAHENGLWATTYSAAELNLMAREFKDAFKSEIKIDSSRSFMKKAWWMFDEKLQQIFEKGTEIYGGMEGFFKTVALRDYIERWEKQNNTSLDNADQATREAVIREAVEAANNNIFDYSKVPGWMRTMRRMPFIGAPFLTYTFKAFPYVIESFARRPQKFIKYAMLPYAMAQAFMLNQDLDDDDYDQIRRMMPKWQKEKSSIYLLPWKDSNGNFQTIDFGYYMPWAPFHNIGMMVTKTFDVNNPILSTGHALFNLGTDLGFVGGPIPQMTSALITNKDPFTGREIIRTAGTTMDKQNDFMRYMVDMWTPTFLTSKGVLGRAMDNLGIEPTAFNTGQQLNALGKDKETWAQTALRGAGVSVRPIDPQLGIRSMVKGYQAEKRKLETARRAIFKDRNLSPESKAAKVREMNEQIKLLNKKHREEMFGG